MITSTKNYTKKTKNKKQKKRTDRTLGQMVKHSYTDKITQRSIHIPTQKKRKKNSYFKIRKKEENKQINKQIYQ